MTILHIEHSVSNFESWKQAFDNDPVGRTKSGVRHYQILRPVDDPNYVTIDLEFDTTAQAEALLTAMRVIWSRVEANGLIGRPQARILERVESKVP